MAQLPRPRQDKGKNAKSNANADTNAYEESRYNRKFIADMLASEKAVAWRLLEGNEIETTDEITEKTHFCRLFFAMHRHLHLLALLVALTFLFVAVVAVDAGNNLIHKIVN